MTETVGARGLVRRGRSPSFPSVALETAVARVRSVYEKEGRNPAPVRVIQEGWGYSAGSGPANLAIASLKKFGLLVDEGSGASRQARLTDLALEIIHNPDPSSYIREAALRPTVHTELWEQYKGRLPSDATLKHELIVGRNFTDSGAAEFIGQFRKTISFARLDEIDSDHDTAVTVGEPVEATAVVGLPAQPQPATAAAGAEGGRLISLPILLVGGALVTVSGEFPISEMAWTQLLKVLEAMKPGLVEDRTRYGLRDD